MVDKRSVDELSIEELEQALAIRKRERRMQRLRRLEGEGRLVGATPQERPTPPPLPRPTVEPAGATNRYRSAPVDEQRSSLATRIQFPRIRVRLPSVDLRWVFNRFLLIVEIAALLGLVWIIADIWQTRQMLNREVSQVQQEIIEESFPTPSPTPLIDVVLLPGGHTSPISEGGARQGEAGGIPDHLLPLINSYKPPPIPTPGPEHAVRIVIPAINVDHPIVQGDTYEQLKKGVGQHIGTANPGETGNMVVTAHNDIYGEIFRRLDELQPGDEIIVYTLSRQYVYAVQFRRIVDPWEVSVMAPTRTPAITLISCYPYLLDTERIVIIGALKAEL
jgi:sortase A